MPLFEVAILEVPTKKEIEDGTCDEKLVFGPKAVVARDASMAGVKAVMENPEDISKINKNKMVVLIRPFG